MKKLIFTILLSVCYLFVYTQSLSNTTWINYLPSGDSLYVHLSLDTLGTGDSPATISSLSTYEVLGNTFTIQDFAESPCSTDSGNYTFSIQNDTLDFTLVSDPCAERIAAIRDGVWVRIPAPIIYVKADATGANDGSSWENAYTNLHDALENYNANDEIWVAAGTYLPQNPSAWPDTLKRTFYIHQNVSLYGGFNGTETALHQRDPSNHETVLSGDINGDDVTDDFETNKEDNVINVMYIDLTSTSSVIDGFTISGGQADGSPSLEEEIGGGALSFGMAQFYNCQFQQNFALTAGGGLFFLNTNGRINKCTFSNNTANNGAGGIFCGAANGVLEGSSGAKQNFQIIDSKFTHNQSTGGGAIGFQTIESNKNQITIRACEFEDNQVSQINPVEVEGAAIISYIDAANNAVRIEDCLFNNNTSEGNGGAIFNNILETATHTTTNVENCIFTNNNTVVVGGAIQENTVGTNHTSTVRNCEFINNIAGLFGGGYRVQSEDSNFNLTVEDCVFDGNEGITDGGGLEVVQLNQAHSNVAIRNTSFLNNSSENQGAGLNFYTQDDATSTFLIENLLFDSNINGTGNAEESAAGFSLNNFGQGVIKLDIQSSIFKNNTSENGAGAIQLYKIGTTASDTVRIENCLLVNNTGQTFAGGIGMQGNIHLNLKGTTIADNENGGIRMNAGALDLQNTILFNPEAADFSANNNSVTTSLGGNLIGDNSMMDILTPMDKSELDPLFAGDEDYQLTESSPAIDAGIADGVNTLFDLVGNDRIQGGCIDIGALESPHDAGTACLTSIKEVIVSNEHLSIFPNPVAGMATVSIDNDWQGTLDLRIVNALGQEVLSKPVFKSATPSQWQIDVSDLAVGIYQVLITDGERMMVEQFMKIQ